MTNHQLLETTLSAEKPSDPTYRHKETVFEMSGSTISGVILFMPCE
jgi:hypothetical protein